MNKCSLKTVLASLLLALALPVYGQELLPRCPSGEQAPCFDPYDQDGMVWANPQLAGLKDLLQYVDQFASTTITPQRGGITLYPDGLAIVCPIEPHQPCGVLQLRTIGGSSVLDLQEGSNVGFIWPIIFIDPPDEDDQFTKR